MIEPVQGESGVVPASVDFLRELRAVTRTHECLLIVDEVQTGMGRTGKLFAYQHFVRDGADEPDIMTLGKGLGAGVPLAALCAKAAVSVFDHGEQGGTYNGNPLMTAVGCAVMGALLEPGFLESVAAKGRGLSEQLNGLVRELGLSHERGWGLLRALDLGADIAGDVVDYARDRLDKHPGWEGQGLLLNAPRPNLLRFMPALTVSAGEIDRMIEGARIAIQAVRGDAHARAAGRRDHRRLDARDWPPARGGRGLSHVRHPGRGHRAGDRMRLRGAPDGPAPPRQSRRAGALLAAARGRGAARPDGDRGRDPRHAGWLTSRGVCRVPAGIAYCHAASMG
jgi:hypothetical protein